MSAPTAGPSNSAATTPCYTPQSIPAPPKPAPIHIVMEDRYAHELEIPLPQVHERMLGTAIKYFQNREGARDYLARIRREAESVARVVPTSRELFKDKVGKYIVKDFKANQAPTWGNLLGTLDGGEYIGVVYWRGEPENGGGNWIEFDVKGYV